MKPAIPITTSSLLSRGLGVFASGYGGFLLLTVVFAGPSLLLNVGAALGGETANAALVGLAGRFAEVFLTPIATGAIVLGVFQRLRGEPIGFRRCFDIVFENWVGILLVVVVIRIAVLGGFLCLVIPGLVAAVGLFVAIPALVVEDLDVFDACSRSWQLTRGHWGPIFVMLVLLVLVVAALVLPAFLIGRAFAQTETFALAQAIYSFCVTVIANTVASVLFGVTYHDLRLARDETAQEDLAAVFA